MTTHTKECSDTLYLPLAQPNREFAWEVFHGKHRMGAFATQDECFRHALKLADSIGRHAQRSIRLKIEDEDGNWEVVEGYQPVTAAPQRTLASV
jgi:hypothetical protein